MFVYNHDFSNKIAQLCINHFKSLPKTGKPNINEWTILSCIAQYNCNNDHFEIVSLGTGSKCIGATKMSPNGDILNDSHAEIICRRAFLRYLYNEITNAYSKNESIFKINNDKCELDECISFHFFTTHMPCGDASIFPKQNDDNVGFLIINKSPKNCKRPNESNTDSSNKKIKIDDIFRTGAKCLPNDGKQDPKEHGNEYHILGAIRTKPGRGDPTLSVSCSDKLSKWTFLGIQGALLTYFLKYPIYIKSITIAGGNVPFSEESLLRCFKNRFKTEINLPEPFKHTIPLIGQTNIEFEFCKDDSRRPCPSSIIWTKVPIRSFEVAVDGKKQGVTKKNKDKKEGRLLICKKELFETFINIILLVNDLNLKYLKTLSYKEVKNNSEYFKIWNVVKSKIFKIWTEKNENLLNFMFDM